MAKRITVLPQEALQGENPKIEFPQEQILKDNFIPYKDSTPSQLVQFAISRLKEPNSSTTAVIAALEEALKILDMRTSAILVEPHHATIALGTKLQFTANAPVTWSVTGFAGGTISQDGLYSAASLKQACGEQQNIDIVTAISVDGSGSKNEVLVLVV